MRLIDWVCANWQQPDEGIWEVRGGRQEFLYSRVMCWVAIDRAIRLARKRSFPAPLAAGTRTRDAIYQDIFTHFWDASGSASCSTRRHRARRVGAPDAARQLRVPDRSALDVHPARDRARPGERLPRLPLPHRRAASPTGSRATRAPSTMCSFWYVECLSRMGDLHQARFVFEKMLGYANHLGLYGEELGPQASTSATSRRRSLTWRSSAPPTTSTAGSRPLAMMRDRSLDLSLTMFFEFESAHSRLCGRDGRS